MRFRPETIILITFACSMSALETTYKQSGSFMSKIGSTAVSLLKTAIRSKAGVSMPQSSTKSCIILGNGPSLKDSLTQHPEFIRKHSLICVNAFSLSAEYVSLKPERYVLLDPSFWMTTNELLGSVLSGIAEKTTWKLYLFMPFQAKSSPYFDQIKANKNIEIIYFNYTVFKGFDSIAYWFYKNNLAMPQSQNVLVASLFIAINCGYKEIYVVGADHTWHQSLHVDDDNRLCIKDVHFYDKDEKVSFKPFRIAQNSEQTHRMDEIFTIWGKTFYGYIAMNKYAEYRQASIYNASEISFIDAFKRIKL